MCVCVWPHTKTIPRRTRSYIFDLYSYVSYSCAHVYSMSGHVDVDDDNRNGLIIFMAVYERLFGARNRTRLTYFGLTSENLFVTPPGFGDLFNSLQPHFGWERLVNVWMANSLRKMKQRIWKILWMYFHTNRNTYFRVSGHAFQKSYHWEHIGNNLFVWKIQNNKNEHFQTSIIFINVPRQMCHCCMLCNRLHEIQPDERTYAAS